jgi:hypothetical protein
MLSNQQQDLACTKKPGNPVSSLMAPASCLDNAQPTFAELLKLLEASSYQVPCKMQCLAGVPHHPSRLIASTRLLIDADAAAAAVVIRFPGPSFSILSASLLHRSSTSPAQAPSSSSSNGSSMRNSKHAAIQY